MSRNRQNEAPSLWSPQQSGAEKAADHREPADLVSPSSSSSSIVFAILVMMTFIALAPPTSYYKKGQNGRDFLIRKRPPSPLPTHIAISRNRGETPLAAVAQSAKEPRQRPHRAKVVPHAAPRRSHRPRPNPTYVRGSRGPWTGKGSLDHKVRVFCCYFWG